MPWRHGASWKKGTGTELAFSLSDLNAIVAARAGAPAGESYTAGLLDAGMEKCARKLGEEAVETVIAAIAGRRAELTKEAADLLYHLLVVLKAGGVELEAVMDELESRTALSGIEEKAGRGKGPRPGQAN